MNFAPVYVVYRFFHRIYEFFEHWYADGSRAIGRGFIYVLEELDHTFAVQVTLRHFFEPLYKDYSVIGRILGVVFRTLRVAVGGGVYLVLGATFLFIYIAWILFPPVILFYAFLHL